MALVRLVYSLAASFAATNRRVAGPCVTARPPRFPAGAENPDFLSRKCGTLATALWGWLLSLSERHFD